MKIYHILYMLTFFTSSHDLRVVPIIGWEHLAITAPVRELLHETAGILPLLRYLPSLCICESVYICHIYIFLNFFFLIKHIFLLFWKSWKSRFTKRKEHVKYISLKSIFLVLRYHDTWYYVFSGI